MEWGNERKVRGREEARRGIPGLGFVVQRIVYVGHYQL